jgi:uncharacterized protein (TIGR02145 family)
LFLFSSFIFPNTTQAWTCGSALVDSRDSQSYSTVLIGAQCWMQQNINVGTMVTGATTQGTSCASIKKYCYENNEANCTTYGALYQWNQAMCGSTTAGAQGICPLGWHVPTHDEFTTLERAVCTSGSCVTDFPYDTTTTGARGTNEGTTLQDMSGLFRAVLAGEISNRAYFDGQGYYTTLWSSTQKIVDYPWFRFLSNNNFTKIDRDGPYYYTYGLSVRCLADTKTLTYTANSNGSITGTSTQTINYGSDGTQVTAVPDAGYHFVSWSDSSTTNPRTDTSVIDNLSISATFAIDEVVVSPVVETRTSSGSSASRRIKNLISQGKTQEANQLQQQFPNAPLLRPSYVETTKGKQGYEGQVTYTPSTTSSQPRDLRLNSQGNDVKTLQTILNIMGYTVSLSGFGSPNNESTYFGEKTKQALIKFQLENGVTPAEGYFGSKTRDILIIKLIKLLVS